MKIYDRHTGSYEQIEQYGAGKLEFLYNNPAGRLLLRLAVSPLVSGIYGKVNSTRRSAKKIPAFIEEQKIDMSQFEEREYKSFNDFFTRKIKPEMRPVDMDKNALISPADSKLLVYMIDENTRMNIKGRDYTVSELLGEERVEAEEFRDGLALVFRLCVDDYHRYCFPDSGKLISTRKIKGKLHTVSPVSKDHKIYKENTRVVSLLETDNLGVVTYIEVGALLVGKIIDHGKEHFDKGEEKGYFEPGGSTVIMLVKGVKIDEDIMRHSAEGIETKVRYGERIGEKIC